MLTRMAYKLQSNWKDLWMKNMASIGTLFVEDILDLTVFTNQKILFTFIMKMWLIYYIKQDK